MAKCKALTGSAVKRLKSIAFAEPCYNARRRSPLLVTFWATQQQISQQWHLTASCQWRHAID